jgi:hypothetical protein
MSSNNNTDENEMPDTVEVNAGDLHKVLNRLGLTQQLSPNADVDYAREQIGHVKATINVFLDYREAYGDFGCLTTEEDGALARHIADDVTYMPAEEIFELVDYDDWTDIEQSVLDQRSQ